MLKKIYKKLLLPNVKNSDLVREKWVKSVLKSLHNGMTIIDCGAGECKYKESCKHLKYVSQDFCQFDGNAIAGLDKNGKWDTCHIDIVSDIIDIPVEDHSFDYVLCSEVLEHIKEPSLAIKEFSRIIKNDGKLILTAPFMSYTHFAPYHYCSGFDRYWYEEVLKDYGFEIVQIETSGNYFDVVAQDMLRCMTVASEYSIKFNIIEKFVLALILRIISNKSKKDRGSNELGCFHYFIIARKV